MKRKLQGRYVTISVIGEKFQAFVPAPLPPSPPIQWTLELRSKFAGRGTEILESIKPIEKAISMGRSGSFSG